MFHFQIIVMLVAAYDEMLPEQGQGLGQGPEYFGMTQTICRGPRTVPKPSVPVVSQGNDQNLQKKLKQLMKRKVSPSTGSEVEPVSKKIALRSGTRLLTG